MTIYKNLADNSRLSTPGDGGDPGSDDDDDDPSAVPNAKTPADQSLSHFEKMEEFSSPLFDDIDKKDSFDKSEALHISETEDTTSKKPS